MARHRVPTSTAVINSLLDLGVALGYQAEPEYEVTASGAAVDVAWFREPGSPLFIFEIETRASSSAANNPSKVYGQTTERFVKPLFFFHVFLSRSEGSERIDSLRTLFGTQNYRAYRLGAGQLTGLIKDVLAQHRRVVQRIHLLRFIEALEHPAFATIERDEVLREVELLGFGACYIPDYALLALNSGDYRPHLVRQLFAEDLYPYPDERVCWYSSYLASICAAPLHLGILDRCGAADAGMLLERLREWQGTTQPRLRPALGLSREHDDFIVGWSPPLWALVAALFRSLPARRFCAAQLRLVVDACRGLRNPGEALFPALWLLWLSAAAESASDYAAAAAVIDDRGGLNPAFLAEPPSLLSFAERDEPWWSEFDLNAAKTPPFEEFQLLLVGGEIDVVPGP